jgi:hypothetical protein
MKIDQTLKEAHTDSIRFELLKDCPETIPTLAQWVYDEWHSYDRALTKEKLVQSFKGRLNSDKIPITIVALKNKKPIGVFSLKHNNAPELDDLPADFLWLGSLQTVPAAKELDEKLLNLALAVSKQLGFKKLHVYLSNPTYVPWYVKRGAKITEKRPFRNHEITILCFAL